MSGRIQITGVVSIPEEELRFKASRSSGPGGQHVNKVSSRVTLLFDLAGTPSLSAEQKRRVFRRLAARITKEGLLRVVSQRHRSQAANRREVVERFVGLMRDAVRPVRHRRRTTVPAAAKRRRLEEKRKRGALKRERFKRGFMDD